MGAVVRRKAIRRKAIKSKAIKSKWIKTRWMLKNRQLKRFIPHTMLFDKASLKVMLAKYPMVYFKPTGGTGGAGIIRIDRVKGKYRTQYNTAKKLYSTLDNLYIGLKRFSNGRSYLLQKGIVLARTRGNPFDIRVMVQKSQKNQWVPTAIFTKIGKKGKVANNYHQGGSVSLLNKTLAGAGYRPIQARVARNKLNQLGIQVGKCFDRQLRGFRELGLDVAIDRNGVMWILEVNTKPQFYPLKPIDRVSYNRILRFAKLYGRYR